ncbi:MAG: hypothetical protein ACW980_21820 [Promethearchaeota archaeon]|jgi:hypothetical protein
MKTITQQLNIKEFPFKIKDKNGRILYFEDSEGVIIDNRVKKMTIAEAEKEFKVKII